LADFQKYLCISTETSQLSREEFLLDRVAWQDVGQIHNLSDYDRVVLNLTALQLLGMPFKQADLKNIFDPVSWMHIVASGGSIYFVGDPETRISINEFGGKGPTRSEKALEDLLPVRLDRRSFDYRRISRPEKQRYKTTYDYLDAVRKWSYSIRACAVGRWEAVLKENGIQFEVTGLGETSYFTFLAFHLAFRHENGWLGSAMLLPPLGLASETEDALVLHAFLGVELSIPEPGWAQKFHVPHQSEIEAEIAAKQDAVLQLEQEIADHQAALVELRRWVALLYNDGHGLEDIVGQALELLGASVTQKSKEKHDFRVHVEGFRDGVMEIKGSRNPRFERGTLRQLAGWMDEVNHEENLVVKGIFVGNAARNDEPQNRGTLFEDNIEKYAEIKDIVILRSMDVFCFVVLKILNLVDTSQLWKEIFDCKGRLDASNYWAVLPKEFQLPESRSAE